jgi:hypothetical protein
MARFSDIDIHDFGNEILLAGAIYAAGDKVYACFFPDSGDEKDLPIESLDMDRDEWIAMLAQLDALDVKVVDGTGEKAILRKSTRIVDNNVSWAVFRRDGYTCRYCGANEVPLSVDHLVLWEQGGPWTMENLVTCCKRDNKKRGQKSYADWLKDPYYLKLSQRLSPEQRAANEALLGTLDAIPRVKNIRSR